MLGGDNEDTVVAEAEAPVPTPPVTDSIVVANKTKQERLERERNTFKTRTFTVNGVSFKMVAVEGGTFLMGSNDGESDEKPVRVTLSDYYIGETEVTQELWQAVMGNNPANFKGDNQRPVEQVSYNDCLEFIKKLNDHLAGQLPAGRKFRLPTEAQWEYAARGGKNSNDHQYSGSDNIDKVAWYNEDWNIGSTHPVGKKSPNELGLYDMSGNVWEWCSDSYGSYTRSSQTNPEVTSKDPGSFRVLRGGSWNSRAQSCRVASRGGDSPDISRRSFGLRLAF